MMMTTSSSASSRSSTSSSSASTSSLFFAANCQPSSSIDEKFMANFKSVSLFTNEHNNQDSLEMAGLGISHLNPWQLSSAVSCTSNGFNGSDSSSAPLSPNSNSTTQSNRNNMMRIPRNQAPQTVARNTVQPQHLTSNFSTTAANPSFGIAQKSMLSRNFDYHPGMRDLTYWLKKLRLHKYTSIFEKLTYAEMMSLNSESLEKLKVTTGARRKIIQSIEKLRDRPKFLKNLEQGLIQREKCLRCAICIIRQLLWCPFIRYESHPANNGNMNGSLKRKSQMIDGFNVPIHLIDDNNIPALLYRIVELLNSIIFPISPKVSDLEDEYLLTMFQIFDSITKNDQFTLNQQKRVVIMKKNARNYANPEEMRKHRMGMLASPQCERCHHEEVLERERALQRKEKAAEVVAAKEKGYYETVPMDTTTSTLKTPEEQNPPTSLFNFSSIWITPENGNNTNSIWSSNEEVDNELPSTSDCFNAQVQHFPEYRSPIHQSPTSSSESSPQPIYEYKNVMNQSTFDFLGMLRDSMPKPSSPNVFSNFPGNVQNKANSTGSGYLSSSDSESSHYIHNPPPTPLSPSTPFHFSTPLPPSFDSLLNFATINGIINNSTLVPPSSLFSSSSSYHNPQKFM